MYWYCIYVKVFEVDRSIMVMKENIAIFRKHILKYLGVRSHDICKLLLKNSGKNYVYVNYVYMCMCVYYNREWEW